VTAVVSTAQARRKRAVVHWPDVSAVLRHPKPRRHITWEEVDMDVVVEQLHRPRPLVTLDDEAARQPEVAGAKAASLARSRQQGLPVLDGFVITTSGALLLAGGGEVPGLLEHWAALADRGRRPLVVRSSSTAEDGASSSMAGLFTSVLGVLGWDAFLDAVRAVLASAGRSGLVDAPMAVLVQPQLAPLQGGVLFGADPLTGAVDRLLVSVVDGGPDRLVSGEVDGTTLTLSRRGRVQEGPRDTLAPALRRGLGQLAARAAQVHGGPQDIEWATDEAGRLFLLQARPITAMAGAPTGPRLGPGPVAETFPDVLAPLEEDLWVAPLRQGLGEALVLAGVATERAVRRSPVVATVGGRVAADLALLGVGTHRRRRVWSRLDPRPPARRLRAAWRVGRLRVALPALATDLVEEVDEHLAAVPNVHELPDAQLLAVLRNASPTLVALHAHEVLIGLLAAPGEEGTTAATVALGTLAHARAEGLDVEAVLEQYPGVLALVPPRIGPGPELPEVSPHLATLQGGQPSPAGLAREALRLRARWVHELTARAAWELGQRLTAAKLLPSPGTVRLLRHEELVSLAVERRAPADLHERLVPVSAPLPTTFRLDADGRVVPERAPSSGEASGTGAGGGRGTGLAHHDTSDVPDGAVLVVPTLDPGLAALLPRLAGLVAETGSPLSHLAILARELGVPTVVAHRDARRLLAPGTRVLVDGATGQVDVIEGPTDPADPTALAPEVCCS
jgi:pyruvate,water dikinase